MTFADYLMPTAREIPTVETMLSEDAPSPLNTYGFKGAGEGGITPVGAAIASAIDDALQRPGAVTQLPVTPQRLKAMLRSSMNSDISIDKAGPADTPLQHNGAFNAQMASHGDPAAQDATSSGEVSMSRYASLNAARSYARRRCSRWHPPRHSPRTAQFSFAYDQPKISGYGAGAEMFNKKLKELSKGTLSINQYPSAQLGTEAQTMQKVQTGDIDFVLLSTANASTAQPESGVFSIHFIFRDETHAIKVLGDPKVIAAMKELYAAKIKGAHMLGLGSQGLRHIYGKKPVAEGRRPQGREDARAGHGDGRHAVPGLWRAGRAHALRRGLHLAADRRRRHGRERHQQLPHQQALRARARAFADGA